MVVLSLGVASAHGQSATDGTTKHPTERAHFDSRNFDGVWHLAEGGKFGPVAEKQGVKYVEYPFTPEYQAIYDKRLADAAAGNPYQTAGDHLSAFRCHPTADGWWPAARDFPYPGEGGHFERERRLVSRVSEPRASTGR